ncbi:LysR family transcriptional regulator [Gluconobacter sphaericus]|jgi:DNA-binding transcriptional LysR family regulator|uniref:LysR family transcriptional regulator n=1 Tax=Gluconobacter sphaericus TaxID=574987 RepID=UPI001B8B4C2C|nr:LysR family transcriptional regulator [Gluconobacter sphaericus]MBS1097818.1 LysR family transcriptional regulator [Gluconobacter sphaericus]MCH4061384.1 LysR family transcriptional regulator [Acetobacter sp.]MCH4088321.1 LysR family transcriptional regulator [Acetobacter sp.]
MHIMQFSRSDLADFTYFLAIARHRNFRKAGLELGISASALSHALKGLETRLGIRLVHRTNRSVNLTAAGEELCNSITAPFAAIGQAVEDLNRFRDSPTGRIRLNVVADAAPLLLGPVLPVFMDRYPDVDVEITSSNRMVDVVRDGYDAGIRYGGTVPQDMIVQRLSADIRWVVTGAPAYLERFGTPETPYDLKDHRCLRIRLGDESIYQWEFQRDGKEFAVHVPGTVTIDESQTGLSLARNGAGLFFAAEPVQAQLVSEGTARIVLEDWSTTGPGYHVYYSSRQQVPSGLKLLIDLIREMRPLGF